MEVFMGKKTRASRKYNDEQLNALADHINKYVDETDFPLIIDCELDIDVYDGELFDIYRRYDHELYRRAFTRLDKKQKTFLMTKGLVKDHDSQLTKFILSSCHGMSDKTYVVTETVECCIEADVDEIEKAEAFENKRVTLD
jgi:hypothetical protein